MFLVRSTKGRLEYNSRFIGPGVWSGSGSGSEQKFLLCVVDDNWDGLRVQSVVQVGGGSAFGIITDDSETLGLVTWNLR